MTEAWIIGGALLFVAMAALSVAEAIKKGSDKIILAINNLEQTQDLKRQGVRDKFAKFGITDDEAML